MEQYQIFQYCPKCSKQFSSTSPSLEICGACGMHFFISPKPSTCAILMAPNGQILLSIRNIDPFKGTLELPGGFTDLGETFEQTIVREVKEEIGIELFPENFSFLASKTADYPYKGINYKVIVAGFLITLDEMPDLTRFDKNEIQEVLLLNPEDIDTRLIALDADRQILEDYLKSTLS